MFNDVVYKISVSLFCPQCVNHSNSIINIVQTKLSSGQWTWPRFLISVQKLPEWFPYIKLTLPFFVWYKSNKTFVFIFVSYGDSADLLCRVMLIQYVKPCLIFFKYTHQTLRSYESGILRFLCVLKVQFMFCLCHLCLYGMLCYTGPYCIRQC